MNCPYCERIGVEIEIYENGPVRRCYRCDNDMEPRRNIGVKSKVANLDEWIIRIAKIRGMTAADYYAEFKVDDSHFRMMITRLKERKHISPHFKL
ncbi:hypothetical protein COJ96_06820 [Bacillus sp. AFS073361]|uniref:hypothetical protein n=1 Tax=Bacillus sp. AFS073361 TaxID=2033511 RepID=UPI000BF2F516|nr:hypothetical protein [Bacillus sp. AFS073361]PFP30126.1 hypothetical protein COJ96_06820 [Bacillus sp. AFS073361]